MLLALYACQTTDEQDSQATSHKNGAGFNGFDAPILSNIAQWVLSGRALSPKQADLVRRKLRKYAKQLAEIAVQQQMLATIESRRATLRSLGYPESA